MQNTASRHPRKTVDSWLVTHDYNQLTTERPRRYARYVWSSWSDGRNAHNITAPAVSTTYTANFTTQFMLTMTAARVEQ